MRPCVRIGSRKSQLALTQTDIVIKELQNFYPNLQFEIETNDTIGDLNIDTPLPKIGEKSLFTRELELSLQEQKIDIVVHSLKDLPTTLPENLVIGAIMKRKYAHDVVIMNSQYFYVKNLMDLPKDSIIGTSSLRRMAQIKHYYPHLQIKNIRGNLNTRLRKLDEGLYDAIILAYAGIERLGLKQRISQVLDDEDYLYAVGQGVLAVECLRNRKDMLDILKPLNDPQTLIQIIAERSFLKAIQGGCSAPVGIRTSFQSLEYKLKLQAMVSDLDGIEFMTDQYTISLQEFADLYIDDDDEGEKDTITSIFIHDAQTLNTIQTSQSDSNNLHIPGQSEQENTFKECHLKKYLMAAEACGNKLAQQMIAKGASTILEKAREECKLKFY